MLDVDERARGHVLPRDEVGHPLPGKLGEGASVQKTYWSLAAELLNREQ